MREIRDKRGTNKLKKTSIFFDTKDGFYQAYTVVEPQKVPSEVVSFDPLPRDAVFYLLTPRLFSLGLLGCLRRFLVGLGFLRSVSYKTPILTHGNLISVGKCGPNATF